MAAVRAAHNQITCFNPSSAKPRCHRQTARPSGQVRLLRSACKLFPLTPRTGNSAHGVPAPLPPSVEQNYRKKCIELKRRMNEVDESNDAYRLRKVRLNRGIMKLRLERAFMLEQLARRTSANVEDSEGSPSPPPTVRVHVGRGVSLTRRSPRRNRCGRKEAIVVRRRRRRTARTRTKAKGRGRRMVARPGRRQCTRQPCCLLLRSRARATAEVDRTRRERRPKPKRRAALAIRRRRNPRVVLARPYRVIHGDRPTPT